jgi:TM2 domain-containing membrane protein YozV
MCQNPEEAAITGHKATNMKHPGTAAVLSLIIPGVGQFYNGDFLRGIFWLIVTPGLWIGSGGTLGWICHIIAAATAHHRARYWNDAAVR